MSQVLRDFRRGLQQAKASHIEPCLPSLTRQPPSGPGWLHEIKHDGYRMMVRRDAAGVRIITRNGYDWTSRYPLITAAAKSIKAKAFLIDGEAVSCDDTGLAVFERIRHRRNEANVFLYAFDLLSLNGKDIRRESIEDRKAALSRLVRPRPRHSVPRSSGIRRRPDDLSARVRTGLRRHRLETPWLSLRIRSHPRLDKGQEFLARLL